VTEIAIRPAKVPVPDRLAVWGLLLGAVLMLRVPVLVPSAVGVNVTEMVHVEPAARLFGDRGQFDVCAKSPEVEIPEIFSASDSLFFTVTVLAALVAVGCVAGNVRLPGVRPSGSKPVPLKDDVCGLFGALSTTVSDPVFAPDAVGVKVTEIVHAALAAKVLGERGQFEVSANAPVTATLEIVKGVGCQLVMAKPCAELSVLTNWLPKL
jgi:hypothetical protein